MWEPIEAPITPYNTQNNTFDLRAICASRRLMSCAATPFSLSHMGFNKQLDKRLEAFRARLAPDRGLKAALAAFRRRRWDEEKPEAAPSLRRAREIFRDAQHGPQRDKLKPSRPKSRSGRARCSISSGALAEVLDAARCDRRPGRLCGWSETGADFGDKGLSEVPQQARFGPPHAPSPSEISLPKKRNLRLAEASPSTFGSREIPWRCRHRCRDERVRCETVGCRAYRQSSSGNKVCLRKATTTASSSADRTVDLGSLGPVRNQKLTSATST